MNLVQVSQLILKGHSPVRLTNVIFLLPITAGRDVEWRIEEYSVRLFYPAKACAGHECGTLSPRHGASSGCGWRNGLQYGG